MCHLECFHNPVISSHTVTAQCGFVGSRGMAFHCLVHHVYDVEVGVALLYGVHPLFYGFVLLRGGKVVHPARVLRPPHQCVEFKRESVLFGIVVCVVAAAPVEAAAGIAFYRAPFRLVLAGDLVPKGVEGLFTVIHVVPGRDIA